MLWALALVGPAGVCPEDCVQGATTGTVVRGWGVGGKQGWVSTESRESGLTCRDLSVGYALCLAVISKEPQRVMRFCSLLSLHGKGSKRPSRPWDHPRVPLGGEGLQSWTGHAPEPRLTAHAHSTHLGKAGPWGASLPTQSVRL